MATGKVSNLVPTMNVKVEFNGEEAVDLRRALRDYIDSLKTLIIREVEKGNAQMAKQKVEDLRRYEALYLKVRSTNSEG